MSNISYIYEVQQWQLLRHTLGGAYSYRRWGGAWGVFHTPHDRGGPGALPKKSFKTLYNFLRF